MKNKAFFNERGEQSRIKSRIVRKYFEARTIALADKAKKLGYVDLFAGPGTHGGEDSTPIDILKVAIASPKIHGKFFSIFNDKEEAHCKSLREEIQKIEGLGKLTIPPEIYCSDVDGKIAEVIENTKFEPTLFFIDPCGYRGLSKKLVQATLKHWGCETLLFFNYNDINRGITNPEVEHLMLDLFGEEALQELQKQVAHLSGFEREKHIMEQFSRILVRQPGQKLYSVSYRVKFEGKNRTSHYLFFVTQDLVAYKIMKEIMAGESNVKQDGFSEFCFDPSIELSEHSLINFMKDRLTQELRQEFAGHNLSVGEIIERHNVGKPYLAKNYKSALLDMENCDEIVCTPPANKRQKRQGKLTMGDKVVISFPSNNNKV